MSYVYKYTMIENLPIELLSYIFTYVLYGRPRGVIVKHLAYLKLVCLTFNIASKSHIVLEILFPRNLLSRSDLTIEMYHRKHNFIVTTLYDIFKLDYYDMESINDLKLRIAWHTLVKYSCIIVEDEHKLSNHRATLVSNGNEGINGIEYLFRFY